MPSSARTVASGTNTMRATCANPRSRASAESKSRWCHEHQHSCLPNHNPAAGGQVCWSAGSRKYFISGSNLHRTGAGSRRAVVRHGLGRGRSEGHLVMSTKPQQTTAPMTFADLVLIDAIRRENHCDRQVCAYEDGCTCWTEFVAEKERTHDR